MDEYENVFRTICRLCLKQNSVAKMLSLFDNLNEGGLSSFGKAVTIVTNVILQKDDKLPNMMCIKCVYLLKHAIYFKLMCESNDQKLKRLINSHKNNGLSDDNIKEKICDYVLFSHYFSTEKSSIPTSKDTTTQKLLIQENVEHKIVQKSAAGQSDNDMNQSEVDCAFDNFIDNDDIDETMNDNTETLSDEINNILDTIETIINSETNIQPSKKRKIKQQRPRYIPIRRNRERNLICNICNKVLANSLTYDHHMQRHDKCRYICDQCGKGFPVLSELDMHQIARHGIGPYLKCDHCPYKAPRKITLIEHLRIHTGERPFTCEKCGLTFRRRAIWRNHLVLHMEKKHQCSYCSRKFYMHSQMLAHCNNVHERKYMYMCKVCSITYTKTETVRRHMTVKHGIPREKQGKIVRVTKGSSEFNNKIR